MGDVLRRLADRRNAMVQPPGRAAALRAARYVNALAILQVFLPYSRP